MDALLLAKRYNNITGSSVTHRDIEEWGFLEFSAVELAMEIIREQ
jgi:hypothetical protein